MKPNHSKLEFSYFWTNADPRGFITSDTCHNYGIMDGCDEGCPALLNGDCEFPQDAIKCCEFTEEEKAEVLSKYEL